MAGGISGMACGYAALWALWLNLMMLMKSRGEKDAH